MKKTMNELDLFYFDGGIYNANTAYECCVCGGMIKPGHDYFGQTYGLKCHLRDGGKCLPDKRWAA